MTNYGDALLIEFPFKAPTPAAAFARADILWLVFDTGEPIDLSAINGNAAIREASVTPVAGTQIVRIKLERPRLTKLIADESRWTLRIGEGKGEPTLPVAVMRNAPNEVRPTARVSFDDPRQLHRIDDPEVGDTLLVVTALGPARGIVKSQDFVEFRALASIHGVVIQPLADDLNIELAADRIMIARPGGLILSSSAPGSRRIGNLRPAACSTPRPGASTARRISTAACRSSSTPSPQAAGKQTRGSARLDLARFYFARDMYPEAKGVRRRDAERRTPDRRRFNLARDARRCQPDDGAH